MENTLLTREDWNHSIQDLVRDQNDVQLLCASDDGSVVSCQTSSLLMAAYCSALRQSFHVASVMLCQDFSQECVQIALEFLAFGECVQLENKTLMSEVSLFFQSLGVSGYVIDGYKKTSWGSPVSEMEADLDDSNIGLNPEQLTSEEISPTAENDIISTKPPNLLDDDTDIQDEDIECSSGEDSCDEWLPENVEEEECLEDNEWARKTGTQRPQNQGIWSCFTKVLDDARYVECMICNRRISLGQPGPKGQTIAPAKKHLNSCHPEHFKRLFPGVQPKSYQSFSNQSQDPETFRPKKFQRPSSMKKSMSHSKAGDRILSKDIGADNKEGKNRNWEVRKETEEMGIWSCFKKDLEDTHYVECLICHQRMSLGPEGPHRTIAPAKKHLRLNHPDQFQKLFPGLQPKTYQTRDVGSENEDNGNLEWKKGQRRENQGIWSWFTQDANDSRYLECTICLKKISIGIGSNRTIASAKRHLHSQHPVHFSRAFPGIPSKAYQNEKSTKEERQRNNSTPSEVLEKFDESQCEKQDDSLSLPGVSVTRVGDDHKKENRKTFEVTDILEPRTSQPSEKVKSHFKENSSLKRYFEEDSSGVGSKYVTCKICGCQRSLSGPPGSRNHSTGAAKTHLRSMHPEEYSELVKMSQELSNDLDQVETTCETIDVPSCNTDPSQGENSLLSKDSGSDEQVETDLSWEGDQHPEKRGIQPKIYQSLSNLLQDPEDTSQPKKYQRLSATEKSISHSQAENSTLSTDLGFDNEEETSQNLEGRKDPEKRGIWSCFNVDQEDTCFVECTICLQRLSLCYPEGDYRRTTSSAKKHLFRKHWDHFQRIFPGSQPKSYQQLSQDSIQTDAPKKYQRPRESGFPRNPLWEYLQRRYEGSKWVTCKICEKEFSLGGDDPRNHSIHPAKIHFKRWHSKIYNTVFKLEEVDDPLSVQETLGEQSIQQGHNDQNPKSEQAKVDWEAKGNYDKAKHQYFDQGPPARVLWKYLRADQDEPKYVFCLVCPNHTRSGHYLIFLFAFL